MGNLQDKVNEVPTDVTQESEHVKYPGLNLLDNVAYNGGTSIKYWM
jgi:hypothetical protein